jgi:hypothetical protein
VNTLKYFKARSAKEALVLVLMSLGEPFWSHTATKKHLEDFTKKETDVLKKLIGTEMG